MANQKGGKKIGSNSRGNPWWKNGGPSRMAKRKARNHGCGKPAMHTKPGDLAHSGMKA